MRLTSLALSVLFAAACGRTAVVRYSIDAGPPDAGRPDAGPPDAGPPDAGPPDAGPPDAGPPDAGPCLPRPVPLLPAVSTVMFVIDRSCSMADDLDGNADAGTSRWQVLETSLRTVLPPLDQQIAMGALMYPLPNLSCEGPSVVDLSPARGNAATLLSLFSTRPLGGTPTFGAVDVAAQHLGTLRTASSARAVILATDGAPNCNEGLDRRSCVCTSAPTQTPPCDLSTLCLDDSRTIRELGNLFVRSRLPTYVIGLGSQLNAYASTLDQMAVAGSVPRVGVGPRYYSAANQAELTDAFSRITAQLTRCTYLLNGLGPNDTFQVQVGGVDVPEGPAGWEWLDQANGELRLQGVPCDEAANGAAAGVLVDCH